MLRIAIFQAVIAVIAATATYLIVGEHAAKAVWFGGLVATGNVLMLAWGMRSSMQLTGRSPGRELAGLVRSSLERFFMVALLIAAGLGWLKLMPAPLLLGFVLGQLVLVVSTIISGIENR